MLTNPGAPLSDYIALTTIDTATPIAGGLMRADAHDLHVVLSDGGACADVTSWIETGVNTTATKLWLRLPLPTGSTTALVVSDGTSNLPVPTAAGIFGAGLTSLHTFTAGTGTTLADRAGSFNMDLTGTAAWAPGFRPGISSIGGFTPSGRVFNPTGGPAFGSGQYTAWSVARVHDVSGSNTQGIIGSYKNDGFPGWALKFQQGPGALMHLTYGAGAGFCQDNPGVGAVPADTWSFVGTTRGADGAHRTYQDGTLVGTSCAGDTRNVTGAGPFELGRAYSGQYPLDGSISISATYNRALSDAEMATLHQALLPAVAPVVNDVTAPDTSITATPADPSNDRGPSFSFTGDDGSGSGVQRYECRLDSTLAADFSTCTSPLSYSGLADGSHTFQVRAIDFAGNVDATPASFTWTIDATGPATTVTSPAEGSATANTTPTLTFASEPGATLTVSLDGAVIGTTVLDGTGTGTITPVAPLAEGVHTVTAHGTDALGNDGPETAVRHFTVDATPAGAPDITGGPAAVARVASFTFTGEPGARFECRIDSGAFTTCTSPYVVTAPDGPHTFDVRQVDAAGNVSPASSRSFTLDTTAPLAPTILAAPNPRTTQTAATFAFGGEPGGTLECRVGTGAYAPCTSPTTYTGLTLGAHVFSVRQTDAAGNVGPPATVAWTVETIVPPQTAATKLTLAVPPVSAAQGSRVPVGCRVDKGRISQCVIRAFYGGRVVGRGNRTIGGSVMRAVVNVTLNGAGRTAVERVGGARLVFKGVANGTLGDQAVSRVLPASVATVPTDGMFATGSSRINRTGRRYLLGVAAGLRHATALTCVGHTDAVGTTADNQRLGLARAVAVCRVLRASAPGARLTTLSAGELAPRASNGTVQGRALNRRVDLRISYR